MKKINITKSMHDFTNSKAGEIVYSIIDGWGTIDKINDCETSNNELYSKYPILVKFVNSNIMNKYIRYTMDGKESSVDLNPTLFKNKIVCKAVIEEELVFKDFIEENGIKWEDFLDNCKVENQRFTNSALYYDNINYLKELPPSYWINKAFSYLHSTFSANKLVDLSVKWKGKVKTAINNNINIKFD